MLGALLTALWSFALFPLIETGNFYLVILGVAGGLTFLGMMYGPQAAFFAELNGLAKYAEFTVVPFDTEVSEPNVFVWKKNKKQTWERVSCGGTCFNAPTQWVNERQFDGHIILTDMEAPKPRPSKCQRMWATIPQYAENPYFSTNERILVMD